MLHFFMGYEEKKTTDRFSNIIKKKRKGIKWISFYDVNRGVMKIYVLFRKQSRKKNISHNKTLYIVGMK